MGKNSIRHVVAFILIFLPSLAFALKLGEWNLIEELHLDLLTFKQAEWWLMVAMGLTGTAFLGVILVLLIRRKKTLKAQAVSPYFPLSLELPSEEFYSALEEVKEPPFAQLAPYENEISLRLKLAQHYLEVDDRENAVGLLEEAYARGHQPERDLAKKLLETLDLK